MLFRFIYSLLLKNHINPNTAEKDSWNPAFITEYGLNKNMIIKASDVLRKDNMPRPNMVAMNINVVIKKARNVAILIPDIHKYKSNPNHAHIKDGYFAGMRLVIYGIERNIK